METTDLTEQETTVLCDVLETYLSELHTEISHTYHRDFKETLKERQELIRGILQKLASRVEQPV